jgi:FG-GAP-like repeat
MANTVTLLDASHNTVGTFGTIQDAVNAASNGYTVEVGPGTYQEQVTVNGLTNLTIEGMGADPSQVVILSPNQPDLATNIINPGETHTSTQALIGAENGASVTITNLTVNGNNQGSVYGLGPPPGGGDLIGIEGVDSSLTISDVHVTGTEDVESGVLQGGQGNKGIVLNDTNGSTQTLGVTDSTVDNFQKAGIFAEGTGLTVNISSNKVTGVGTGATNISQNLVEVNHGATGTIANNTLTGISDEATGSTGFLAFQSGGLTITNNTVTGFTGNVNSVGIWFLAVDGPTVEGNNITGQGFALFDDGVDLGPFNVAAVQNTNTYGTDTVNYTFLPDPTSTTAWTVTGTGGPDDLEGSTNNDVFTVSGGAPNGNVFVGHGGIDTVQGYGAGYHVAIQSSQWVVTNGTVTDTLTGMEKVVINGQTYDLVDNFGQDTGGFQTLQGAVNAAQPGDVVVTDIGSTSVTVGVDNLTFEPLQGATGITLTLANTGVQTVSLADYASGQGVPVTVDGNDLGDTFRANDGGDTFAGGAGNDTFIAGAGTDTFTGGGGANVFAGTAANLNGDTINDFVSGDKIVITDADPAHFAFHVSGTTLSYDPNTSASATFDTITLANAPGPVFSASADPVSGVDIRLGNPAGYDFNGDAISDLAFQNEASNGGANVGTPQIWLWNGTAVTSQTTLTNPGAAWHIVAARDVNGDGKSDLIWQAANGQPGIWLMNGATPTAEVGFANPGADWHLIAAGDLNADGHADLIWQDNNGTLGVWLMNGTTPIAEAAIGNPGANWTVVGAADFNHDGRDDILLQDKTTGNLMVDEMNGTTVTSSVTINLGDPSWHAVSTGAFNGVTEIAFQNSNGTPGIWLMNGTTPTAEAALTNPGTDWKLISMDHFTANGQADLLFQNTDGAMGLWELNGTKIVAEMALPDPGGGIESVNGNAAVLNPSGNTGTSSTSSVSTIPNMRSSMPDVANTASAPPNLLATSDANITQHALFAGG